MSRRFGLIPVSAGLLLLLSACGASRIPRLAVPIPFGVVDSLGEPQQDGTIRLSGWVLSEDPILSVSLYIDRRYVASARLNQPRPDVNRVYPAFGAVQPGWTINLDPSFFPGDHDVLVQARTLQGAVRDLRAARLHFEGAKTRPL